MIIVGGPRWSQNLNGVATNPLSGRNIVYSAHYYPIHGGSDIWDSNFGNASNYVPFFNTEWGFQHDGDVNTKGTVSSYGQAYKDYLNSKGISWTAWTFDNDWLPLMFSSNPNWHLTGSPSNPDGDSSYNDHMGQFVKDWLFEKNSVPCDVNGDGQVDLADAILCLKVLTGMLPDNINPAADVNGDGKIGMAEVICILQTVAGL